jgi:superfamily II DNA/RNA helicase
MTTCVCRAGALRLHRCPILILDEADQLLGDVYSADISHIVEHCGKRLEAAGADSSHSSSTSPEVAGDSQTAASLRPSERQTVLVSATLWAGGLVRFKDWCPAPVFVTMGGAAPTMSPEGDAGDGGGEVASPDSKAWGWGAKGWEGPASIVQQGPKTQV